MTTYFVHDTGNVLNNGTALQNQLNSVLIGDTIVLDANVVYQTNSTLGFTFPALGTSWNNQRTILQSANIGSLPSGTQVSPANTANFAKLFTQVTGPVVNFSNSRGWTLQGIEMSYTSGVLGGGGNIDHLVEMSGCLGDVTLDRCWVHTLEAVSDPTNPLRACQSAIRQIGCPNFRIVDSYINGFVGWPSNNPTTGVPMVTYVFVIVGEASHFTCKNTFLQSYIGTFCYPGNAVGAGQIQASPAPTLTSCRFDNVVGLNVGDLVGFQTQAHGPGGTGEAGQIQSITGTTVTFGPRTTDVGPPPHYLSSPPLANGFAFWSGPNPSQILFQRNTFDCPASWEAFVNPNTGHTLAQDTPGANDHRQFIAIGLTDAKLIGNHFTGSTKGSIGLFQEQGQSGGGEGLQPYVMIANLLMMHNFLDCNPCDVFDFGLDSQNNDAVWSAHHIAWVNGLSRPVSFIRRGWAEECGGTSGPIGYNQPLLPGYGVKVLHATIRGTTFGMWAAQPPPNAQAQIRNVISNGGDFWLSTASVTTDYPNLVIDHNLLVGSSPPSYIPLPIYASDSAVGFTNSTAADAGGAITGYTLTAGSPGYAAAFGGPNIASGEDIGVNITTLQNNLNGTDIDWEYPEMPRVLIDTTYHTPTGTTYVVNNSADWFTAIGAAVGGDLISITAGITLTGNFVLPPRADSGIVYIQTSAYSQLPPPGTRVSPANAAQMPTFVTNNSDPAMATFAQSHGYRFVGINFTTTTTLNTYVCNFDSASRSLADMPHHITMDRCLASGNSAASSGVHVVALQGATMAVVDSYIYNGVSSGSDAQAIFVSNGSGPFKIVNNYLEASGENMIIGGEDPAIPQMVPADFEIRNNLFFKPLAWKPAVGVPGIYSVKNLFEVKNAQRLWIQGNTFQNNWPQTSNGQDGHGILFNPRNQNGFAPWCRVTDITFRGNVLNNSYSGFNLEATDDGQGRPPGTRSGNLDRVLIQDNIMINFGFGDPAGDPGNAFLIIGVFGIGVGHVVIDHNFIGFPNGLMVFANGTSPNSNFVVTNNVMYRGANGVHGDGSLPVGEGASALNAFCPGAWWYKNLLLTTNNDFSWASNYSGLIYSVINDTNAGFTNAGVGDYRLTASSPGYLAGYDGTTLGVDFPLVVTVPTVSLDFDATARPTSGAWDIGAYQFTGSTVVLPPTLTSLNPATLAFPASPQTCTVNGTGFVAGATVFFDGAAQTTTFVNANQVTFQLTAGLLAAPGTHAVTATNPGSVGSNSLTFSLVVQPPGLLILTPNQMAIPAAPVTCFVTGTGFISGAVAFYDGVAQPTTFVNSTQITFPLTSALIATPGVHTVTATNPSTTQSNALTLTLTTMVQTGIFVSAIM